MNKTIWTILCEAVWNKEVVIDITNLRVTTLSLERWFASHSMKVRKNLLMRLAAQLAAMLRTNKIQTADYGCHPEISIERLKESKEFLDDDIEHLQSFTPDLLEKAARMAGFELGVYDVNEHHPLGTWE